MLTISLLLLKTYHLTISLQNKAECNVDDKFVTYVASLRANDSLLAFHAQ